MDFDEFLKLTDSQAEYLSEGRRYELLSEGDLNTQWVTTLTKLRNRPLDPALRNTFEFLDCEWKFRGAEPPYNEHAEAVRDWLLASDRARELSETPEARQQTAKWLDAQLAKIRGGPDAESTSQANPHQRPSWSRAGAIEGA